MASSPMPEWQLWHQPYFVRIALGTLLERFGPVNVQSGLLTFGAIWVALAATIQVPWQYTIIRFFIGCAGLGYEIKRP